MDYRVASNIRGKSFSDLMSDKISGGGGIGSSLRGAISDKIKAEDWPNLFLVVCDKYLRLVAVVDTFLYAKNNLEIKQIIDCTGSFMKSAIPKDYGYEVYVKIGWGLDNLIAQYISKVESP